MNHTPNFQLTQWERSDRILMEDFNADNAKIDAALQTAFSTKGNCEIVCGQYTGNGLDVRYNPITLTFAKKPLVVIVCGVCPYFAVRGATYGVQLANGTSSVNTITWGEKSLTWVSNGNYSVSLNTEGVVYPYIALLEA